MKASELIESLMMIVEKYGDMEVQYCDEFGHLVDVKEVDMEEVEGRKIIEIA